MKDTLPLPFFLNMNKLEVTSGSHNSPKESNTLGRSGGLGNALPGNKREIGAFKELLVLGWLFTKRPGVQGTTSERKIQGRRSSTGSAVQIPAPPPWLWDPGRIVPPLQASASSTQKRRDKYLPTCRIFTTISDDVCHVWHIVGTQEMVTTDRERGIYDSERT